MVGQQMAVSFGIKLDDSLVNGAVEVIRAGEGLMSEVMPLQVAPDPFNIVQLRGVFRQPLDREPVGARREGSAACLTRVDRAVVEDKHDGLEHYPELGTIAPINLLQQSRSISSSRAMKSELRLVRLVRTMSLRRPQSSTPSIATLALWPGAGMRRSAPFLAQTCARYGWVSASDSSPNKSTMSPASAWAVSSFRRRPARSTASGSWRPFSVWRGRRQRKPPFSSTRRIAVSARGARPRASRSHRPNAAASSSGDPPPARTGPLRPRPARIRL